MPAVAETDGGVRTRRRLPLSPSPNGRVVPRSHAAWRVEAAFLAGTAAVATATVGIVMRLWQADVRVPFIYFFDAIFNAAVVKSIVEHGWLLHNPSLGAPAGLEMHDFPLGGDNLQFVLLRGIGLLFGNWAAVMNAYFLLGFVLVAVAAYAVLRQIGFSRWMALALANLFAVLPYHFVLGETQLFQTAYFAVPLGAFLVFDTLGWDVWRGPFLGRTAAGRRRSAMVRWGVRAGMVALVASAGSYYAPFTMVLVAVGSGLALLAGDRRAALRAIAVVGLLGAVLIANNLPTLLYQREHGRNTEVADRALGESDLYALPVVDLFLPARAHRLAPFAAIKVRLDRFFPVSPIWPAPQTPLGVAGAAGVALSLVAVASAAGPSRRRVLSPTRARLAQLGLLNLAAILVGAATGFSALLALVGITQVRVWSRLSVFIGFFGLVALGQALQVVGPRAWACIRPRRLRPPWSRAIVAGLVVAAFSLAVLDQTQPATVAPYAANRAVFMGDRAFVADIERRMPPGAAIFQLPLASFPEGPPIAAMLDYGLLRGYLHSRALRWSYASMRGRPADWAWSLGGRGVEAVVDGAVAGGFSGLYVDRSGFFDRGAALEAELAPLVGPPAIKSGEGLAFWDLRDRAAALRRRLGPAGVQRLRDHVLRPVVPHWRTGFKKPVGDPAGAVIGDHLAYPATAALVPRSERVAASAAVLELVNPLPDARPVRLRLTLRAGAGIGTATVTVVGAGATTTVTVGSEPQQVDLSLVLPPGPTPLTFTSAGDGPASNPVFRVGNVMVIDDGPGSLPL